MNNMLSVEEVKSFLELSQEDLEKHLQSGKIRAYKIGGTYLRFRKEDILNLRSELRPAKSKMAAASFSGRVSDFWRFNNFYILSLLIVAALLTVIVKF